MNKKKAFTIVELMVVVGMIAIIIMLVAMNFQKTRAGARDRIRIADIQKIRLALQEYRARCGEFPARLELDEASPNCPAGFTFKDVISELPKNPKYADIPTYYQDIQDDMNSYDGYFYSGLSTSLNGSCYEYHLGVVLESALDNSDPYTSTAEGRFLKEDHDCPVINLSQTYDYVCAGSSNDFPSAESDSTYQMYDFRSAKNC